METPTQYLAPPQARGEVLVQEAAAYLGQLDQEVPGADPLASRIVAIRDEVERNGTYRQTDVELEYGARMAWRNSNRCIGRLYWRSLHVNDMRHLTTPNEIFAACLAHLNMATNGGKIQPVMTVFATAQPGEPGIQIWNPQLIRYAGYVQPDGRVVGDPAQVRLTQLVEQIGWQGKGTPFDLLPLVIAVPGFAPQLYELPPEAVLEVDISHPQYEWFADLGLKWHAVPAVSNMRFVSGGIHYTAAPFSGWYMGTEIGARNFGDGSRYNLLPVVAAQMGLNTSSDRTLWRDRALVELNVAVLHSFQQAGVTTIDHHTATRHFMQHVDAEAADGREVTGDWAWLVPPLSGSATPVFHRAFPGAVVNPNFYYQPQPWA
jgi:nitric-oxide synthase